ncbi:FERM and PDZ domain-containing protein 1 [Manis javanica]|nr:FERM and PDZ domain-containing protein 1 [Manis javanica]
MMQGAVYDTFQHLVQLASSWFRCAASAPGGLVFCNKHRLPLGDSERSSRTSSNETSTFLSPSHSPKESGTEGGT